MSNSRRDRYLAHVSRAKKTLKVLQVLREAGDAGLPSYHLFPMVSVYDASARSCSDAYAADSLVGIGSQEEAQMLAYEPPLVLAPNGQGFLEGDWDPHADTCKHALQFGWPLSVVTVLVVEQLLACIAVDISLHAAAAGIIHCGKSATYMHHASAPEICANVVACSLTMDALDEPYNA